MKKHYLIPLFLLFTCSIFAQTDGYYVQIGVFEEKVGIDYFSELGSLVNHSRDAFGFHRYYKGKYETEEEARKYLKEFSKKGYNCYLVAGADLGNSCRCNYIPIPQSTLSTIKNIFFDFDRSDLRAESRKQLSDLVTILKDFPTYRTTLRAHTDAKGSNDYNERLSLRRAESAKRYLISRGISSSRIKTETYGEVKPIAKNELNNGEDTELGRQFNRRVEILIIGPDGNILNEIVDEIEVPEELEN